MAVSVNDVPDKLSLSDYGGNYTTYNPLAELI